jgi:predicted transcriptional regulator
MTTPLTLTEIPMKRRDKLDIVAEIMDISRKGALKTQIMYRGNLSFAQLTIYLSLLTQNNLLSKMLHDGKEVFFTTQKGRDFLEKHQQVKDLLREEDELSLPPEGLIKTTQQDRRENKYGNCAIRD